MSSACSKDQYPVIAFLILKDRRAEPVSPVSALRSIILHSPGLLLEILVHVGSSTTAIAHSEDDGSATTDNVTTGEYIADG